MEYYLGIFGLIAMVAILPVIILNIIHNRERRASHFFLAIIILLLIAYEAIAVWGAPWSEQRTDIVRATLIFVVAAVFLITSVAIYKQK